MSGRISSGVRCAVVGRILMTRPANIRRLTHISLLGWLLVLVASSTFSAASAASNDRPATAGRSDVVPLDRVSQWTSPRIDHATLALEDVSNLDRKDQPLRIGYPMTTDLDPGNSGTWDELRDGSRIWRLRVRSDEARWIVLGFDLFRLQEDASLFVYDPSMKAVQGPFTAADVRDHGELWFPPMAGDTLVVELDWPAKLAGVEPRLHLGTVSHGYKPFGSIGRLPTESFGDSGSCNIDVKCPLGADWLDERRGVVILLSGGSGFCTGSLINTTANDCRPYMLTAHHCGAGASTTIGFNFERPACGSGTPPPETTQTLSGAVVLGDFASSDFTLLRMNSTPPESYGAYFNGWSRSPNPATQTWVIHHPEGDAKKISHDADPPINGSNFGSNHWRVQNYEQGTTEPGSSGSPLFDQNSRIVGQLHGGTASCSSITYDEYGKVAESWTGGGSSATRLSDWLDPGATGAMFADGLDHQICLFQAAGTVNLLRDRYACSDTLSISLRDDDLRGAPTQTVTVSSPTEPGGETVTLTASAPNSGIFNGTFSIAAIPPVSGDGTLSVSAGDTVTVSYFDADDGNGQSHTVTDTALVDCTAPLITGVAAMNVSGNSADIIWTTNEAANSRVHYGLTPPGSSLQSDTALVTSHSIHLTGLSPCSSYIYWVDSTDAAGNLGSNNNGGAYFSFQTGQNVTPTYTYSGPPVSIPDNNPGGASATVSVPDTSTLQDVNVKVNITHTYDGDLTLSLIGPDSTTVVLSNQRGTGGDNFVDTVFDDAASTPIASGSAPFTGSFRPDAALSAFNGKNPSGTWTLKVVDGAAQDTGTINNFSLTFTYPAQACGASLQHQSHTVSDACSGTGSGGGNTVVDPGESVSLGLTLKNNGTAPVTGISAVLSTSTPGITVTSASSSFPNMAAGQSAAGSSSYAFIVDHGVPCGTLIAFHVTASGNEGTWGDNFTVRVGQPGAATNTYVSTDVPKPIADNATITSSIVIADPSTVTDVNVTVNVTHSYDGDLLLTLIGPTGTRVTLSNRHGSGGDNYVNTVFDDEAGTPIASGTPPFTGNFRPDAPLSAIDGVSAAGTWKLEVQDAATQDTGTVTGWSLTLGTTAPDVCNACTVSPPGEVPNMQWSGASKSTLQWSPASNASYYYVFRGDQSGLPALLNASPDSCSRAGTGGLSVTGVSEGPAPGAIHWFLVRGLNSIGMGPSGNATAGPRLQDSTGGCP